MKILISADMEGITGVTHWDQVNPSHAEYPRFRKLMTGDVNAAIQGALEGGADEILVADGHAYARNLLIEELDPRVRLNAGHGSPFSMLQGVDSGVDGAIFIGYHACAGSLNAILDHTLSSSSVANVRLNGALVGEIGLNAALCGHFNVPLLMISGDQTACGEAKELLGALEFAVVKQASGRTSAECLSPRLAHSKICEAAARAVHRLRSGAAPQPFRPEVPVRMRVEFLNSSQADSASLLPGAERLGGREIAFQAPDMPGAYRALRAAVALARS